jgi:hypothetical protein
MSGIHFVFGVHLMLKFDYQFVESHDYDPQRLIEHLQAMYNDTQNYFFAVACMLVCGENELPLPDPYTRWFSNRFWGLFMGPFEGRELQQILGLGKETAKRKQFNQLWHPDLDTIALWYPRQLLKLIEDIMQRDGCSQSLALDKAADKLAVGHSQLRDKYFSAKRGEDIQRALDIPDWDNNCYDPSDDD